MVGVDGSSPFAPTKFKPLIVIDQGLFSLCDANLAQSLQKYRRSLALPLVPSMLHLDGGIAVISAASVEPGWYKLANCTQSVDTMSLRER